MELYFPTPHMITSPNAAGYPVRTWKTTISSRTSPASNQQYYIWPMKLLTFKRNTDNFDIRLLPFVIADLQCY